jgi:acetylornithine deacetylase/succinyl-diaminopimelate desuccinylase-like protein
MIAPMTTRRRWLLAVSLMSGLTPVGAGAQPSNPAHPQAESQALDLAKRAIALRSVTGAGNETIEVARLFSSALIAGGFNGADISITPVDDTAYLVARWHGRDASLKPLVISGHLDVVEAKAADWQRDPFTPVIENGYLYGRGAADMKFDGALAIAALLELKRGGFLPRRDIVLEFSGDEETTMKTSAMLAEQLKDADLVLNIDGGGGTIDETSGRPLYFTWQGAEKTYADFELTVTNAGGHSSQPRRDNAISQLARALLKIDAYRFTPELNDISRTYFVQAAQYETPALAAAMNAFAANPADVSAIETLAGDPAHVGEIGTTCVTTMVSGGHALNALPQRATANVNCRIFPGHKPADIMAELARVVGDASVRFQDVTEGSIANDASPIRPDFVHAVEAAMAVAYPGVPVFPSMASGASDSMWFRAHHVPSYGASPVFIKSSDDFSHGLNERIPLANIAPGITYYLALVPALAK